MLGKTKRFLLRSCVRGQCGALRLSSTKFRYQPTSSGLIIGGSRVASTRECHDRLGLIIKHLPQGNRNVLDIGSNTGYYLFELARLGYLCHGIDSDPELVCYTSLMTYLTNCNGVSCEVGKLDLSFIERMPSYDVILCLSVMHHIILAEGLATADAILQKLATKTKDILFFEMGQSNEISADWSGRLPVMTPDPETWISSWLLKSGFSRVKTIGTSHTTVSRFVIAAFP
jgi:SAM-dependent methyltransferase